MHALVLRAGAAVEQRHEVPQETSIGRASAAIMLSDAEVSRRHAVVRPVEGGLQVEDLGSTNGTWLNGRRIAEPTVARHGDVIRVGRTQFEVVVEGPPASAATVGPAAPVPLEEPTRA
ncbi:MAG TPA: FHA domain-containing protein, partial [Actinomycetota bacterium]|nr:FHA domain-containing protein [Actinomycetota bacterium]